MVDETLCAPLSDPRLKVRVIALRKAKDAGPFAYLQGMRSGLLKAVSADPEETEAARAYHRHEKEYFAALASAISFGFDAVLSPPSGMPWQAQPYRSAIWNGHPSAVDLTERVGRTGDARAGKGASVEDVLSGLSYSPTGRESEFGRIVVIDDTFTTGTTRRYHPVAEAAWIAT